MFIRHVDVGNELTLWCLLTAATYVEMATQLTGPVDIW